MSKPGTGASIPQKPLAVSKAKKKLPVELDWGEGIPKDRLRYINADEEALIKRFRTSKSARDYAGIPAYADDSASSKGVERGTTTGTTTTKSSTGSGSPSGGSMGQGGQSRGPSGAGQGPNSPSSSASGSKSPSSPSSSTGGGYKGQSAASVGPSRAPNAAAQAASNAYRSPQTNAMSSVSTSKAPNMAASYASQKLNATSNALKAGQQPQSIQGMINSQPNTQGLQGRTWDTVLNTPYNTVFPERAPVSGVAQSFPGRPRGSRNALGVPRVHSGLDFATAPNGTNVTPAVPGTVVQVAKSKSAYGPTVQVMNTYGVIDRYALHKDQTVPVKVGDPVYPNTVLGVAGKLPGPPSNFSHLHYERITGEDPAYKTIQRGITDGTLGGNEGGVVGSTSSYSRKTEGGVTDAELKSSTRDWAKSLGITQGEQFQRGASFNTPTDVVRSAPQPSALASAMDSWNPPKYSSIPSPASTGMLGDPRNYNVAGGPPAATGRPAPSAAGPTERVLGVENYVDTAGIRDPAAARVASTQPAPEPTPAPTPAPARSPTMALSNPFGAYNPVAAGRMASLQTRIGVDDALSARPVQTASNAAPTGPSTYNPVSAPDENPVYSENPIQGSQNPMQDEGENPQVKRDRQQKYASRGATIGGIIAGPIGTIVGGTLGWQMGKTTPQQRQAIASNPQALQANVQSINDMVEQRGGKNNPNLKVTEVGLKDVLENPQKVTANPQAYTSLEQSLAALSQGIDPETGRVI